MAPALWRRPGGVRPARRVRCAQAKGPEVVGDTGLEPVTSCMSSMRANQLRQSPDVPCSPRPQALVAAHSTAQAPTGAPDSISALLPSWRRSPSGRRIDPPTTPAWRSPSSPGRAGAGHDRVAARGVTRAQDDSIDQDDAIARGQACVGHRAGSNDAPHRPSLACSAGDDVSDWPPHGARPTGGPADDRGHQVRRRHHAAGKAWIYLTKVALTTMSTYVA